MNRPQAAKTYSPVQIGGSIGNDTVVDHTLTEAGTVYLLRLAHCPGGRKYAAIVGDGDRVYFTTLAEAAAAYGF